MSTNKQAVHILKFEFISTHWHEEKKILLNLALLLHNHSLDIRGGGKYILMPWYSFFVFFPDIQKLTLYLSILKDPLMKISY